MSIIQIIMYSSRMRNRHFGNCHVTIENVSVITDHIDLTYFFVSDEIIDAFASCVGSGFCCQLGYFGCWIGWLLELQTSG